MEIDLAAWRRSLDVNLTGYLLAMRNALPHMLKSGGGGIVLTSSSDAFDSPSSRVAYPVTKYALHALCRHVAAKWGRQGVRCNVIVPGLIPRQIGSASGRERVGQCGSISVVAVTLKKKNSKRERSK